MNFLPPSTFATPSTNIIFDLREDPMTIVFLLLAAGAAGAGNALNESSRHLPRYSTYRAFLLFHKLLLGAHIFSEISCLGREALGAGAASLWLSPKWVNIFHPSRQSS